MQIETDIFISYAHLDNEVIGTESEGWISRFHRSLEVRLAQLLGRRPRIWRDPKLQGNDLFADEISGQFPRVATLLPILTPRYVRSEWCQRELSTFVETRATTGLTTIGNKSPIFKVVKTRIPLEQQPSPVQDLLGYEFYVLDPESQRVRELKETADSQYQREYWAKFEDLAQDLSETLQALETAPTPEAVPETPAAGGRATVYLSDTTYELRSAREALKRDLLQHGHQVLPDATLPLIAPDLEQTVGEYLDRSELAIHLVGASYGIVPEGATRSVVELQNEIAVERAAGGGLRRLIWMPPDLEVEDSRQRSFLELLRTDERQQIGADLLETSLEDLKLIMHQRLEPEPEPESEAAAAGEGDLVRIYLVCDGRDLDAVQPLADHLYDLGHEVILPVFEGDEAQIREDHLENLKLAEAVLIYYGQANELWLRAKLRELQKIGGYGRKEPIRAKAIVVDPPASPAKQRLRTREAEVISCLEGFRPEHLQPFLEQLAR